MRVLCVALGSPGHAYPLVPLAVALRDAGHSVSFGTDREMRYVAAQAGLDPAVVGCRMRPAFDRAWARRGITRRPRDPEAEAAVFGEVFGATLPRAYAAGVGTWIRRHRPDLVISEIGCWGAGLAAAASGTPCVTHGFGRRPAHDSPREQAIASALGAQARLEGLHPPVPGAVPGHAYIDICPPSLRAATPAPARTEIRMRPTPWSPRLPGFRPRRHGRPWVHLTLGTAMGEAETFRAAAAGLGPLGVDVLIATGNLVPPHRLADLVSRRVQVASYVPQADLFGGRLGEPPALVVHHGGSGTMLAAATAGLPQLLLPMGADQFTNAEALVGAGVARALVGPHAVTPDAVAAAAVALLGDTSVRVAARDLADEIAAMPSPGDVAASAALWGSPPALR